MVYRKNRKSKTNISIDIDDFEEEYEEREQSASDSNSEAEYVVEKIIDHRKIKGATQYYLKWKGYPEDDNTWENESDVFAPELVEKYWKGKNEHSKKKIPKESLGDSEEDTEEDTEEDQNPDVEEIFKSKGKIDKVKKKRTIITNNQINIRKRKLSDSCTEEPDFSLLEDFPPPELTNWEEAVDDVETVERNPNSELLVYLNWKNGHRTRHLASDANLKCPQKIIRFYEEHLKFKDLEE